MRLRALFLVLVLLEWETALFHIFMKNQIMDQSGLRVQAHTNSAFLPHGSNKRPKICPGDGLEPEIRKNHQIRKYICGNMGEKMEAKNGYISGYRPFPKVRV